MVNRVIDKNADVESMGKAEWKEYWMDRLILSEFEAVKEGKSFPNSSPYDGRECLALLRQGISRGLYTQLELDATIKKSKRNPIYEKLRRNNNRRWTLDHTPFAHNTRYKNDSGLNDYGFHVFIGREVFKERNGTHECGVVLDAIGSLSGSTAESAYDHLCTAVKQGRKVLLAKSPGRWDGKKARLASRTYVPWRKEDRDEMQRRFEADPEMKGYDGPFKYQPQ